ncbi:rhamnulokinase family protein [Chloroflexota bacterium]
MAEKRVIAVDLGASSGRVMQVGFDGRSFSLAEQHRFPNIPVQVGDTLYWDILCLWHEIQTGIAAAADASASVGVDTWGVDFALLDRAGNMLANPVHYRDPRTEGAMEWLFERMPRREVFERTGIQFLMLNTLNQLASLVRDESPLLEAAESLLLTPDLFHYWMTGEKVSEFTMATTTQCLNPRTGDWDGKLLKALGLSTDLLPKIVQPGTQLGKFGNLPVIASTAHDTASAVVAVPAQTKHFGYISSGTWSLVGLEVDEAVISDATYTANVTNEGGYGGKYRFLKNTAGLWFIQQSLATWAAAGQQYSYADLVQAAQGAAPFRSLFDPDDTDFLAPGDMPSRIQAYCQQTGQPVPETVGQITRAVYESLALNYRRVFTLFTELTGQPIDQIHIVGGGARNTVLCQMTADATGCAVMAGPYEATALGNGIVQLITLGEIADVAQARSLVAQLPEIAHYQPQPTAGWDAAYERFIALIDQS